MNRPGIVTRDRETTVAPVTLAQLPATEDECTTSPSSLLGALVIAARYRGLHLSVQQLIRDHRLGPGEPPVEELLRIARGCGLRAMSVTLRWDNLTRMGSALPVILLLRNGSAMVLLRAETQGQPPS